MNALDVIENVKRRFKEIATSLPKSVEIVPVYDRSNLIYAAIDTLKHTLFEESIVVALVCIVFLLHVRSALVAILMLPVGVLMAFGAMKLLGIGSNIMSLGGIAIAIGAMVDAAIVMIENAHKHLERAAPDKPRIAILIDAASEVGPALFFSLLIITVSFMPIFTLESQEGRLFSPLAFTKTFAMAAAALLSVTLVPALMVIFVRGRIVPEHRNPINRFLIWIYRPVIKAVLRAKTSVILLALAVLAVTIWPARQLGTEFMPTLNEGTLLYMPTTLPGISVTKAAELMQTQDRIIKSFPEVASVYGKAGPRLDRDRSGADGNVRDGRQPEAEGAVARRRDHRQPDRRDGQGAAVSRRLQRLDHADQGAHRHAIDRHPHAGRRQGDGHRSRRDRQARQADRAGHKGRAGHVVGLRGTRHRRLLSGDHARPRRRSRATASWCRTCRTPSRPRSAARPSRRPSRAGNVSPSTCAIRATFATTRKAIASDILVPMPAGGAVPLGEVATVEPARGPTTIRTENGQLATYIYVDIRDRDLGGYVAEAQRAVQASIQFPPGYYVVWSGQYEYLRARNGSPEDRRAGDARDHLPAALPQLPINHRDRDRHAVAAIRAGRRTLDDVVAWLQPVGRRRRRLHRACRRRGGDRRRDADLPQPGARRDQGGTSGEGRAV